MLPRTGLLVAILFLVCSLVFARMGESREDCDWRYGEPVRVSDDGALVMYKHKGQSVVVHFSADRADMVSHSKLPVVAGESPSPFTDAQIQSILEANGAGRTWILEHTEAGEVWRTQDGVLCAVLFRSLNRMTVYSQAFADAAAPTSVAGNGS